MANLFNILWTVEIVACITGIIYWRKIKNTVFKYFWVYLLLIVVAECIGRYFQTHNMLAVNKAYYSYFIIPSEFIFFFWLFYKCSNNIKRRLPIVFVGIYLLAWLIDVFYLSNKSFWFYSFSYTIGNLLLLILILRFFKKLTLSDEILYFKQNVLFWISFGLLLFYLGTFPYYGLRNTLVLNYKSIYLTYSSIVIILNCMMYLMFTFSFIWGKPNTKYL